MPTTSPVTQLRQASWLAEIPDTIEVPAIANRPAREIAIEQASVDDIAFALVALGNQRSALMQQILALEDVVSMARKKGAAGVDIAVAAAAGQSEARK